MLAPVFHYVPPCFFAIVIGLFPKLLASIFCGSMMMFFAVVQWIRAGSFVSIPVVSENNGSTDGSPVQLFS